MNLGARLFATSNPRFRRAQRTPGLSLAARAPVLVRARPLMPSKYGPYKVKDNRGFACINILVQRAITGVKKMARRRDTYASAEVKPYAKLKPESKEKVLLTAATKSAQRRSADPAKTRLSVTASNKKHSEKRAATKKRYRDSDAGKEARTLHLATHPDLLVHARLRRRMHTALSDTDDRKAASTLELLGCSRKQFVAYLSRMLLSGNTLHEEEIDHVFPMAMYDFSLDQNQYRCSNYTNMQPLTLVENRWKSDKLPTKAMAAKVDRGCWPDGVTEDMLPDIYPGWRTPLRM